MTFGLNRVKKYLVPWASPNGTTAVVDLRRQTPQVKPTRCSHAYAGQRAGMAFTEWPLVVVAASAGGFQPLRALLSGLPPDLPAAVLVVLHVPASGGSSLPGILDRAGPLSAAAAVDGERMKPAGSTWRRPTGTCSSSRTRCGFPGPAAERSPPGRRPAVPQRRPLWGPQVTAVVLSGLLDDGALGSATVERLGGRVIVQDPADADYDSMPRSAIAVTEHAAVVPAKALPDEVLRLVTEENANAPATGREPDRELVAEIAGLLAGDPETDTLLRGYSDLTCPECGGPLYFKGAEKMDRAETYDCLVGHRWSPESLLEEQGSTVERALWLAIRSLEERGRLTGRLADAARERGHALSARQFSDAADEAKRSADAIRRAVNSMTSEVAATSDGA